MADRGQASELAQALQEVTTRAQLIVREEIELAKLEVTTKVAKLAKGAAVGAAAGVFVLAGLIYLLHALAWLIWQLIGSEDDFWIGFVIVAAGLFLIAALAGFLAYRFVKGGTPPTPQMAIEEAHRVKDTISSSGRAS